MLQRRGGRPHGASFTSNTTEFDGAVITDGPAPALGLRAGTDGVSFYRRPVPERREIMWFSSRLRNWTPNRASRPRGQQRPAAPRCRPRLEALEDRTVPSVTILTVTERGFGKRTPLDEYRLQGRAGKGIIDIKTGGRNGNVVAMLQVRDGDDILVVTTKGKMIRFHVSDVSSQGRNTWGVRIIDLEADDRVGSVARVESETTAPVEAQ